MKRSTVSHIQMPRVVAGEVLLFGDSICEGCESLMLKFTIYVKTETLGLCWLRGPKTPGLDYDDKLVRHCEHPPGQDVSPDVISLAAYI